MSVFRRLAAVVGVVLGLVVLLAGAAYVTAGRRLARHYDVDVRAIAEPSVDSALLARGAHLAGPLGKCAECHGDDLGGKVIVDDPALGLLSAPNLTRGRGSVTADFTMVDWDRALRHGLRRDGTGLLVMPSEDFAPLTDGDLAALVSYLRQLPPVDREMPRPKLRLVGRALYLAGKLPLVAAERITHTATHAPVAPAVTVEYGAYLADIGGCRGCHGPQLSGGPIPGTPPGTVPAANLTPTGIGEYTEADFFRAMRDGTRPGGTKMDSFMPVRFTRDMTDDEIRALYLFLRTVPPREFGGR